MELKDKTRALIGGLIVIGLLCGGIWLTVDSEQNFKKNLTAEDLGHIKKMKIELPSTTYSDLIVFRSGQIVRVMNSSSGGTTYVTLQSAIGIINHNTSPRTLLQIKEVVRKADPEHALYAQKFILQK